jgi:hypothetical protein
LFLLSSISNSARIGANSGELCLPVFAASVRHSSREKIIGELSANAGVVRADPREFAVARVGGERSFADYIKAK